MAESTFGDSRKSENGNSREISVVKNSPSSFHIVGTKLKDNITGLQRVGGSAGNYLQLPVSRLHQLFTVNNSPDEITDYNTDSMLKIASSCPTAGYCVPSAFLLITPSGVACQFRSKLPVGLQTRTELQVFQQRGGEKRGESLMPTFVTSVNHPFVSQSPVCVFIRQLKAIHNNPSSVNPSGTDDRSAVKYHVMVERRREGRIYSQLDRALAARSLVYSTVDGWLRSHYVFGFGRQCRQLNHFVYGEAKENAAEAVRIYQGRLPNRRVPDRRTSRHLDLRLRDTGSLPPRRVDAGASRTVRAPHLEECILEHVAEQPSTNMQLTSPLTSDSFRYTRGECPGVQQCTPVERIPEHQVDVPVNIHHTPRRLRPVESVDSSVQPNSAKTSVSERPAYICECTGEFPKTRKAARRFGAQGQTVQVAPEEVLGRNRSWPFSLGPIPAFAWNDLGKPWKTEIMMAEPRLACSPPTKSNRAQSPAESVPDFRMNRTGRCHWLAGFLGDLPYPHPFIQACSILISIILIGCQGLAVNSRPNIFTHYNACNTFPERKKKTKLLQRRRMLRVDSAMFVRETRS
ncbi:hypothetical protein PR048_027863 [Dryococelus australis]|uniref:DUF4817 domain-containing protein n=1 Tax=Dryococelus australis TaxID=614101 RepID=A0ABQ9GHP1_9NEOP|nr:hypothetical protein PR048_027863 [Dryococelus australis]